MLEKITKTLLAADFAALTVTAMAIDSASKAVLVAITVELVALACLIFAGAKQGI